jgi:O-antigen/teichoic acid export membrane protein
MLMFNKVRSYLRLCVPFLDKDSFLKNVLFVSGGTVFAQLLVILFSPVISRIYVAADIGGFQQYMAVLSFLLVISGLRYEMAILIPKDRVEAFHLLILSLLINVLFSLLVLLVMLILHFSGFIFSFIAGMNKFVFFIPFALLGASVYQSLNNMIIREKEFRKIGMTKMVQSVGLVGGQVIVGGFLSKTFGLIWGDLLSKFLGIATFARVILNKYRHSLSRLTWSGILSQGKTYLKFPVYSVPSGLVNVAGLTISTFLLGNYFGLTVLGFYALVDRLFAASTMLIGQSVSQVYMGEFVEKSNSDPEALLLRFKNLVRKTFLLTIFPYALAGITSPYIFGWIFGKGWSEAGIYFALLTPMQFVCIIVWPLMQTLNLLERQKWQLVWDCSRLVLVILVLSFSHHLHLSARMSVFLYGSVMMISYLSHLAISYLAIKLRIRQFNDAQQHWSGGI